MKTLSLVQIATKKAEKLVATKDGLTLEEVLSGVRLQELETLEIAFAGIMNEKAKTIKKNAGKTKVDLHESKISELVKNQLHGLTLGDLMTGSSETYLAKKKSLDCKVVLFANGEALLVESDLEQKRKLVTVYTLIRVYDGDKMEMLASYFNLDRDNKKSPVIRLVETNEDKLLLRKFSKEFNKQHETRIGAMLDGMKDDFANDTERIEFLKTNATMYRTNASGMQRYANKMQAGKIK